MLGRRSLLLAGAAVPAAAAAARAQCVTDTPAVDACRGGVRTTVPYGATLDLSFGPPALDPRITFGRSSTATYFNSAGVMQTAATNAPRWDYDPVTHVLRGLLIEEARTNISLTSQDFTTGNWATVAATLTLNQAGAPDGTATFTRLVETIASSVHYVGAPIAVVTASTSYTFSVYAGAQQDRYLQLCFRDGGGTNGGYATFDVQAGTVSGPLTALGTGIIGAASIQAVGGGIYRCSISTTVGANTTGNVLLLTSNVPTPGFAPSYVGNASNGLLIWGAQLEAGTFPSSYIPTAGASAGRALEVCQIPTSTWFSAAALSLMCEVQGVQEAVGALCGFSDGVFGNSMYAILNGTQLGVAYNLTGGATVNGAVAVVGTALNKTCCSFTTARLAVCNNGGAVAAAALTTTPMPATVRLSLGNDPWSLTTAISGYMRRVRYWPRALTDTELQQVTR